MVKHKRIIAGGTSLYACDTEAEVVEDDLTDNWEEVTCEDCLDLSPEE